jgi:CspA family cold shock protein
MTSASKGYEMAIRIKGTIKSWNSDKGFGFISTGAGGKDVFLHITSL